MDYQARLDRIRSSMRKSGFDVIVITSPVDMQYIIGFACSVGTLFITADRIVLLTDYRYARYAVAQCAHLEVLDMARDTAPDALYRRLSADYPHPVFGFDDSAPYSLVQFFMRAAPDAAWQPFGNLITDLRAVKDKDEIACISRACEITDYAFGQILSHIRPGMRELEVAIEIERLMKQGGADQPMAYDIIVASGLRSTYSHGRATNKVIEKNDVVMMDFGCKYMEYCSDFTRTIFMGHVSDRQKEVYQIVQQSRQQCMEALAAGATNFEMDDIAKNRAALGGYREYCGNGVGHGIGLTIHEPPLLNNTCNPDECAPLVAGNVVTVEPTLYYVPGDFGVRIEDVLCVEEKGARKLTSSSVQIIELGF